MAILVFSPNGTYVTKPTLEAARTSADCAGKTVVVTTALTAAQSAITAAWPADRALRVEKGGSIPQTWAAGITTNDSSCISYFPSGTGAVVTTVQTKLCESVSVLDFIDPSLHAGIAAGSYTGNLTTQIEAAQTAAVGKRLYFPRGIYYCNVSVNSRFNWYGDGATTSFLYPYSTATPVFTNLYQEPMWISTSITDMGIMNPTGFVTHAGIGFSYGHPTVYAAGMELIGRVSFTRCWFKGFNKGIAKNYGNIGNTYNQCTFQYNNYGVWAIDAKTATGGVSGAMQPTTDVFNGGEFDNNALAAICMLGYTIALGGLVLNQTVVQSNQGFGVYVSAPSCTAATSDAYYSTWFEANGYPAVNVTIDYITAGGVLSTQSLLPRNFYCPDVFSYNYFSSSGGYNGIGTGNPQAPLAVWGNQRTSLRLLGGGYAGTSWTRLTFSEVGFENVDGAAITSTLGGGASAQGRNMAFTTDTSNQTPLVLSANGTVSIGTDAALYATPTAGAHAIYAPAAFIGGDVGLTVGSRFSIPTQFGISDGVAGNAAATALRIGSVAGVGRSINAGGTVNAAGADYAEYEVTNGLVISKGSVVGFKADGTLTLTFSEAVRFGIKSTNPSFVGGDTTPDLSTVDRIAYSGKVPCNVVGAIPGGYIIAVATSDDKIGGQFVLDPDFTQYKVAVGRVNRILKDNRCEVAVMVH